MKCRICGNTDHNTPFVIDEMRLGMKDSFDYIKCATCGCLQIKSYPENISAYYPSDYYSINRQFKISSKGTIRTMLRKQVAGACTESSSSLIGKSLFSLMGGGSVEKIKMSKAGFEDKILEIGSGTGSILVGLNKYGFKNLWGIDPFIEKDIIYSEEVKVFKTSIEDFKEKDFDLTYLNHAFEHIPNQLESLKSILKLLKKDKYLILSIPIVDTYAWRRFGVNWVGLDAPRHYYIHSIKSMRFLADQAGCSIEKIVYKTSDFDFWASIQYSLGIPLQHKESYYSDKSNNSRFSLTNLKAFKKKARELDNLKDGSTAMFFLKKN